MILTCSPYCDAESCLPIVASEKKQHAAPRMLSAEGEGNSRSYCNSFTGTATFHLSESGYSRLERTWCYLSFVDLRFLQSDNFPSTSAANRVRSRFSHTRVATLVTCVSDQGFLLFILQTHRETTDQRPGILEIRGTPGSMLFSQWRKNIIFLLKQSTESAQVRQLRKLRKSISKMGQTQRSRLQLFDRVCVAIA